MTKQSKSNQGHARSKKHFRSHIILFLRWVGKRLKRQWLSSIKVHHTTKIQNNKESLKETKQKEENTGDYSSRNWKRRKGEVPKWEGEVWDLWKTVGLMGVLFCLMGEGGIAISLVLEASESLNFMAESGFLWIEAQEPIDGVVLGFDLTLSWW